MLDGDASEFKGTAYTDPDAIIDLDAVPDFSLGDVNCNGIIDTDDATIVLKTYAEISISGEPAPDDVLKYGDINFDSKIDSDDAVGILKVYANFLITGEYDWSIID